MNTAWEQAKEKVRIIANELSTLPGHYGWTEEANWLWAEGYLAQVDHEVWLARAILRAVNRAMGMTRSDVTPATILPQSEKGWLCFVPALANELGVGTSTIAPCGNVSELFGYLLASKGTLSAYHEFLANCADCTCRA